MANPSILIVDEINQLKNLSFILFQWKIKKINFYSLFYLFFLFLMIVMDNIDLWEIMHAIVFPLLTPWTILLKTSS